MGQRGLHGVRRPQRRDDGKADDVNDETAGLPREGDFCDDCEAYCNDWLHRHEAECTAFQPAAEPCVTGEFTPPSDFTEDGRHYPGGQTGIFGMHVGMLPLDPGTNRWTTLQGSEKSFLERYPATRVLPNGRIYGPRIGWDHGNEAVLLTLDAR